MLVQPRPFNGVDLDEILMFVIVLPNRTMPSIMDHGAKTGKKFR